VNQWAWYKGCLTSEELSVTVLKNLWITTFTIQMSFTPLKRENKSNTARATTVTWMIQGTMTPYSTLAVKFKENLRLACNLRPGLMHDNLIWFPKRRKKKGLSNIFKTKSRSTQGNWTQQRFHPHQKCRSTNALWRNPRLKRRFKSFLKSFRRPRSTTQKCLTIWKWQ